MEKTEFFLLPENLELIEIGIFFEKLSACFPVKNGSGVYIGTAKVAFLYFQEIANMITIDDLLATDPKKLIEPRFHPILQKASRPNLYRWLQTGRLVGFQLGSRWLTTEGAILEFLKGRAVKPAADKAFLELRKKQVDAAEAKFASRRTRKK